MNLLLIRLSHTDTDVFVVGVFFKYPLTHRLDINFFPQKLCGLKNKNHHNISARRSYKRYVSKETVIEHKQARSVAVL